MATPFSEKWKGAFIIGGAHGQAKCTSRHYGRLQYPVTGVARFSFGGELWREIIFFRDKSDLDRLERAGYTFAAQATRRCTWKKCRCPKRIIKTYWPYLSPPIRA